MRTCQKESGGDGLTDHGRSRIVRHPERDRVVVADNLLILRTMTDPRSAEPRKSLSLEPESIPYQCMPDGKSPGKLTLRKSVPLFTCPLTTRKWLRVTDSLNHGCSENCPLSSRSRPLAAMILP